MKENKMKLHQFSRRLMLICLKNLNRHNFLNFILYNRLFDTLFKSRNGISHTSSVVKYNMMLYVCFQLAFSSREGTLHFIHYIVQSAARFALFAATQLNTVITFDQKQKYSHIWSFPDAICLF